MYGINMTFKRVRFICPHPRKMARSYARLTSRRCDTNQPTQAMKYQVT
jgi:hypothetical protein